MRHRLLIRTAGACAAVAMATAVFAASEADSANDLISSNPLYLPRANHFYGETSYSYLSSNLDDVILSGAPLGTHNSHTSTVQQVVGYGVTDEITVRLLDNYVDQGVTVDSATGASSSFDSSGFTNPTLNATWRAVDQRLGAPVSVDATLAYSPNWMSSRIASVEENGTMGSGRQEASARLDVGRVSTRFTVSGQIEAHYLGTREAELLNNGAIARGDPCWDYTLGVSGQVPVSQKISFNGGYTYTIAGNETVVREDSSVRAQTVGGNHGDLNVGVNYKFVSERLVGQLGYDNIEHERITTNSSFAPASFYTTGRADNEVSARLYYAF